MINTIASILCKICTDICPRTLSVPRSEQFSESEALGKLRAEILAFDIPSLYLFDMHLMRHFLVFQEPEIYDSLESKIALPNIICLFKESPREYNIKTFQ